MGKIFDMKDKNIITKFQIFNSNKTSYFSLLVLNVKNNQRSKDSTSYIRSTYKATVTDWWGFRVGFTEYRIVLIIVRWLKLNKLVSVVKHSQNSNQTRGQSYRRGWCSSFWFGFIDSAKSCRKSCRNQKEEKEFI